jgi:hypothetical protein
MPAVEFIFCARSNPIKNLYLLSIFFVNIFCSIYQWNFQKNRYDLKQYFCFYHEKKIKYFHWYRKVIQIYRASILLVKEYLYSMKYKDNMECSGMLFRETSWHEKNECGVLGLGVRS